MGCLGVKDPLLAVRVEHCASSRILLNAGHSNRVPGIIISLSYVAVGIFQTRCNAHLMEEFIENPVAAYYLGEPEVQFAMRSFQPCVEVVYSQTDPLPSFMASGYPLPRCGVWTALHPT